MREDELSSVADSVPSKVNSSPSKDREDEVSDVEIIRKTATPKRANFRLSDSSTETVSPAHSSRKITPKSRKIVKKNKSITTIGKEKRRAIQKATNKRKRSDSRENETKNKRVKSKSKSKRKSPRSATSHSKSKSKRTSFSKTVEKKRLSASESDTIREARRFLATNTFDNYVVNSYNLRPRKFRFVDQTTRSPYKITYPVYTRSKISRQLSYE